MKRYGCTLSDKRGEFGDCMEVQQQGRYVLFSDVEKLLSRDQALKNESDQWERRACNEATRARDLELLNGELLVALEDLQAWFEAQRKAISKGCGSSWNMNQCDEQLVVIDAAIAKAKAALAGEGV